MYIVVKTQCWKWHVRKCLHTESHVVAQPIRVRTAARGRHRAHCRHAAKERLRNAHTLQADARRRSLLQDAPHLRHADARLHALQRVAVRVRATRCRAAVHALHAVCRAAIHALHPAVCRAAILCHATTMHAVCPAMSGAMPAAPRLRKQQRREQLSGSAVQRPAVQQRDRRAVRDAQQPSDGAMRRRLRHKRHHCNSGTRLLHVQLGAVPVRARQRTVSCRVPAVRSARRPP